MRKEGPSPLHIIKTIKMDTNTTKYGNNTQPVPRAGYGGAGVTDCCLMNYPPPTGFRNGLYI